MAGTSPRLFSRFLLRTAPSRDRLARRLERALSKLGLVPAQQPSPDLLTARQCHRSWHIPNTVNINPAPIYQVPTDAEFLTGYGVFLDELDRLYASDHGSFVVRVNDGEFHFLRGSDTGNAVPGRRHFRQLLPESTRMEFRSALEKAHLVGVNMNWSWRDDFITQEGLRGRVIPAEYIYAGLASGHLIRKYPSLGIIGAEEKIDLIRRLLGWQEFREYVGLHESVEMIGIPQKFAGNATEEIAQYLISKVSESDRRLFIFGMGIAKLGIAERLARETGRFFLDVGIGVDALAGIVDPYRPYMGAWKNFQLLASDAYADVDFCQVGTFGNRVILAGEPPQV